MRKTSRHLRMGALSEAWWLAMGYALPANPSYLYLLRRQASGVVAHETETACLLSTALRVRIALAAVSYIRPQPNARRDLQCELAPHRRSLPYFSVLYPL
jgi:hypothetical protein